MSTGKNYVVGIDAGTGSLRTVVYDLRGNQITESRLPFANRFMEGGGVEQSADEWREGMRKTIADCLAQANLHPSDIKAIGVDGTSGTVAPIARDGTPLAPALLWMDVRSVKEATDINATDDPILRWAGGKTSPEWVPAKILWLKRNRPDLYEKTWMFMEPPDYLLYLLTGSVASSYSNAVHKRHYAREGGGWPTAMFEKVGLGDLMEKWPTELRYSWEVAGRVSADAATTYGLEPGTVVVNAGNDGPIAMLGLGIIEPGDICMTMGTSTCLLLLHHINDVIPGFWGPFPGGVMPDCNLFDVGQISTGSIIEWFRKLLFTGYGREYTRGQFDQLEADAAALPPGATGVAALDSWKGNRTPHNDPHLRGAFWGISLEHGPAHLYRAILEATAFGARQIFDRFDEYHIPVRNIIATGGGSRNPLWMQIYADVLERPITITQTTEACALGCAMGGAVAAGLYRDVREAVDNMVTVTGTTTPAANSFAPYREAYQHYKDAYPAIKSLQGY